MRNQMNTTPFLRQRIGNDACSPDTLAMVAGLRRIWKVFRTSSPLRGRGSSVKRFLSPGCHAERDS
jgi:hypothetical protein